MNFDIEKLERKSPYKTPEHFFEAIQNKVLEETTHKKKETKTIPLFMKWAVAASVTLFAGLTAFFMTTQEDNNINIVKNKIIIDSVYQPHDNYHMSNNTSDDTKTNPKTVASLDNHKDEIRLKNNKSSSISKNTNHKTTSNSSFVKSTANTDSKVNRALAVFTPDQISEIDKSIDQDVYLDLYN